MPTLQHTKSASRRIELLQARATIIARYGSVEAALAPCASEGAILAAIKPWRTTFARPHQRWTDRLDGWNGDDRTRASHRIVAAIRSAYPMPTTFGEALAEARYWEGRNEEIDLALEDDDTGHGALRLDLATRVRAAEVRKLLERELPATNAADVLLRFRIFRQGRFADEAIGEALLRDLGALADGERERASIPPPAPAAYTRHDRSAAIRAALDADQARSDREIATACGCSPTTVGKVRLEMGLGEVVRSVRRGGQSYELRTG